MSLPRLAMWTAGALALGACADSEAEDAAAPPAPPFDLAYAAGEARTLATSAGPISYLEKGAGEPVVFFMPTYDARYWQFQIDPVAQDRRAIAFSQILQIPASSDAAVDFLDAEPLIAGLETLRAEFGVDRVHFVTHSIGGRLALQAAAQRPDLFATLVLEEPAGGRPDPDRTPPQPVCTLSDPDPVALQVCMFASVMSGAGYFETLAPAKQQMLVETEARVAAFLASLPEPPAPLAGFPPICDEIAMLSMPILIVRGADSPAYQQAGFDDYESCLGPHETVVVDGVAHNAHWDAPDAFNAALIDFLARHPI